MPTVKQRRVAKLIIENTTLDKPLNGGEIVENSGYGKKMKLYPKRVIETKGVEEELKSLGFTEENAKSVVTEIMLNPKEKSDTRLKATDQVFKVHGSYDEKDVSFTQNIINNKIVSSMSEDEVNEFLKLKLNERTQE